MSSSSLSQDRLCVAGVINSDTIGLKRFLFDFFTATKLGAVIGPRIQAHETPIQFEGPSNLVNRTLVVLGSEFQDKFPGVVCSWTPPQTSAFENRLDSVKVAETPVLLKRSTSSGDLNETPLEEISLGYYILDYYFILLISLCSGSATTEILKKMFDNAFSTFKHISSPLAHVSGYIKKEHIHLKYRLNVHTIEISTKTWNDLLHKIREKFTINSNITSIYCINNGDECQATEMSDFIDKETYYIRTEIDESGMFTLLFYNYLT